MKYPIGIQSFDKIREDGYIYVDKTALIYDLVKNGNIYFLSRPRRKQQSEGRVDCIVETPDYIYIFEFKLDGTAEDALQQIEEKGYAEPYLSDKRKLYKVGVNFSSESGTVDGWEMEE